MFALSTSLLFYASAYEPHNLRKSYFTWLLKTSHGNWAHFFQAFTPVRIESGITDLPAYLEWYNKYARGVIAHYISPQQMQNLYSGY